MIKCQSREYIYLWQRITLLRQSQTDKRFDGAHSLFTSQAKIGKTSSSQTCLEIIGKFDLVIIFAEKVGNLFLSFSIQVHKY